MNRRPSSSTSRSSIPLIFRFLADSSLPTIILHRSQMFWSPRDLKTFWLHCCTCRRCFKHANQFSPYEKYTCIQVKKKCYINTERMKFISYMRSHQRTIYLLLVQSVCTQISVKKSVLFCTYRHNYFICIHWTLNNIPKFSLYTYQHISNMKQISSPRLSTHQQSNQQISTVIVNYHIGCEEIIIIIIFLMLEMHWLKSEGERKESSWN